MGAWKVSGKYNIIHNSFDKVKQSIRNHKLFFAYTTRLVIDCVKDMTLIELQKTKIMRCISQIHDIVRLIYYVFFTFMYTPYYFIQHRPLSLIFLYIFSHFCWENII